MSGTRITGMLRVLLVEGSLDDAELNLRELRQGGFQVDPFRVETQEAMVAALDRQDWDIILSDFQVPGFGEMTALQVLQASGRDFPFIVVTGAIGEEAAASIMKAGAHDYILKGNLTRLCAAVERELKDAQIRRQEREALAVLKEREASLERAQAIALMGSWEWELDQRFPVWSSQIFHLLGLNASDSGKPLDRDGFLRRVHPDDRARVLNSLEELVATGKPCDMHYRVLRPDGDLRCIRGRTELAVGGEGKAARMRGTLQDVTDHRRLEEAMKEMTRLSAKGQMAAFIAHEINNPLAGIKNALELLRRAVPRDHPHARYADLIKQEIDRIARFIRTMHYVYCPPTGDIKEVGLLQAFQEIESLLQPQFRAHGVTLALALEDPCMAIRVNEGLLHQVLFNLLQNAIEASPREGVVTLGAVKGSTHARIWVEDEGPRISAELVERIFEPGFSAKGGGNTNGLGLDFSTCRNLLEYMGGTLQYAPSRSEKGTVFTASLPL